MQQVIGHKLPKQGVVRVQVPVGLHVFLAVPVRLAFQVTANEADRALHDGHGVAVGIAGHGLKRAAQKGRAIVKVHLVGLTQPVHRCHRAIGRPNIGLGTLDVLHAARALQEVEVIGVSPIRPHADAQVLAAALHVGADVGQIGLQNSSKSGGLAVPAREHHQVHVVEKPLGHLVLGEDFDAGHGREGRNQTIHRVGRAGRVVQKDGNGFLHARLPHQPISGRCRAPRCQWSALPPRSHGPAPLALAGRPRRWCAAKRLGPTCR